MPAKKYATSSGRPMKIVAFEQYRGNATVKIGHYFFKELISSKEVSVKVVGDDYPSDNDLYKEKVVPISQIAPLNPDALFFGTWYINKIIKEKDYESINIIKNINKPKFCIVTDYPYRKKEHDEIWRELGIRNILCLDGAEYSLHGHDYFNYYYFPWSINEKVFFDRKQRKIYDVAVFGRLDPHLYPMRYRAHCLFSRHFKEKYFFQGAVVDYYKGGSLTTRGIMKSPTMEEYSLLLNQCKICFTDGHYAELANAKYSEIAGSNCLIMSPKFKVSKDLELAGFKEDENILYVDYEDSDLEIINKTERILSTPSKLNEISLSGYNLIHQRHTNKKRIKDLIEIIKNL